MFSESKNQIFPKIMQIIRNEVLDNAKKQELVSKIVNQLLFKGINIIECTSIPFVFDNEVQLDYENIDMAIIIKENDVMEFVKYNVVSETTREVKKETFVRNAKKYHKNKMIENADK